MPYKTIRKGELPPDYDLDALEPGEVSPIDPTDPFDPIDPWDKEILDLIFAMNNLPGITTIDSCSGHGERGIEIGFMVDKCENRGLFVLASSVSARYWKHGRDWWIRVDVDDVPVSPLPIRYALESSTKGQKAYQQALDLVQNIEDHLGNKAFLVEYGLQDLQL